MLAHIMQFSCYVKIKKRDYVCIVSVCQMVVAVILSHRVNIAITDGFNKRRYESQCQLSLIRRKTE